MTNGTFALTLGAAIGIVLTGFFVGIYEGNQRNRQEWDEFNQQHDCKVIGYMQKRPGPPAQRMPEMTGYLCDDGMTYWRRSY